MKVIMGMAQAVFGIVFIGFISLFTIIGIGIIVTKEAFDWFRKINKETSEEIKKYNSDVKRRNENE